MNDTKQNQKIYRPPHLSSFPSSSTFSKTNSNIANNFNNNYYTNFNTKPTNIFHKNEKRKKYIFLQVPCEIKYCGAIIGKKGVTRKKIMEESGVLDVQIPNREMESEEIIIKGYNEESVQHAKELINNIIKSLQNQEQYKNKNEPTHFLSLPLIDDDYISKIEKFNEKILEISTNKDFLQSIINPPKCSHLTIATMYLRNKDEINNAINVLKSFSKEIYDILNPQISLLKVL